MTDKEMFDHKIQELQDIINVQCSDGNWNYDEYMHGLANGLILSMAIMADVNPVFLEAPEVWLKDLPDRDLPKTVASGSPE